MKFKYQIVQEVAAFNTCLVHFLVIVAFTE